MGIAVPAEDLQWFVADLLRGFGEIGEYFVPPVVLDVASALLEGRSANIACDRGQGLASWLHKSTKRRMQRIQLHSHATRTVSLSQRCSLRNWSGALEIRSRFLRR